MNNAQFYTLLISSLSALVSSLSALAVVALGLISNNKRLDDMRADLKDIRQDGKDLRSLINKLGDDYTRFYGEQRRQDTEIANLKERLK